MSIYNSGNNDSNKAINLYNDLKKNTQDLVISENVTKTVGVGKDFETLHLALRWAESSTTIGKGDITLNLDDGIHVLGGADEMGGGWDIYKLTCDIRIQSVSEVKENCLITIDPATTEDYVTLIATSQKGNLFIQNITFDISLNGYAEAASCTVLYPEGPLLVVSTVFKNAQEAIWFTGPCAGYTRYAIFDNMANPIFNDGANHYLIKDSSFLNSTDEAITSYVITKSINNTFTNNASDTNIPLNEIQYDGSYISDGTSALSLKA